MSIDINARVAALELLVEQLILERVQQTGDPEATVQAGMKGLTVIAAERPGVPLEAVDALAVVLARVVERLEAGDE